MAIKITSNNERGYQRQEICEFIETLEEAIALLNVLGQMQAVTGNFMMQHEANNTFECQAKLKHSVGQLKQSLDTKILP